MRRKVVVKLELELKDESAAELTPEDLLPDIANGAYYWGGQRNPDRDPLFYPYKLVTAVLSNGNYYDTETNSTWVTEDE